MKRDIPPQLMPFRLHDEKGITLSAQFMCARETGAMQPNLLAFFFDAFRSPTMTPEDIVDKISEACSDNGIAFDSDELLKRAKLFYGLSGATSMSDAYDKLVNHFLKPIEIIIHK